MEDYSITYSVYVKRERVGVYTSKHYALNKIKKVLASGVQKQDIELVKSQRIVSFETF